jgi:hypothetical protein
VPLSLELNNEPRKKPARRQQAELRKETLSHVICLMVQKDFFMCNGAGQTSKKTCALGTQSSKLNVVLKELIYYHNICIDGLKKTM